MVLGQALAERYLTDRCTLRAPDAGQPDGAVDVAMDVPCRLIDAFGQGPAGRVTGVPGGFALVQGPQLYFRRDQAVARGWSVVMADGRRLTIDSVAHLLEAPTQHCTASNAG